MSALLVACASHPGGGGGGNGSTAVIVGLQEETQVAPLLTSVHVTTSIGGAVASDDTIDLAANPQALPKEIRLEPKGDPAAPIAVHVEASGPGGESLVRDATTSFVAGSTRLLRVQLQAHCLATPTFPLVCTSAQTCLDGRCQDAAVAPAALETYESNWASDVPDACKPAGHGDPQVIVGTGQTDYLPTTDGEVVKAEQGPQGGHHIWVAVRTKNLKQSGSTTTISAVQPGTGLTVPATSFVFTFVPDEGGYCKLFGLRFQLDIGGTDYHQFLGQPLDVTVVVKDASGTQASGSAHLSVAPTLVGQ